MLDFSTGSLSDNASAIGVSGSGNRLRPQRTLSNMSVSRIGYEKNIRQGERLSKADRVVSRILTNPAATAILASYVIGKGLTPSTDPLGLAKQALLCRASDIATISAATDTLDSDSFLILESDEQEAYDLSTPNSDNILPPNIQAALKVGIDYLKELHRKYGGSGTLDDFFRDLKYHYRADGFDLDVYNLIGNVTEDQPINSVGYATDQEVDIYNRYPVPKFNNFETPPDPYYDEPWLGDIGGTGSGSGSSTSGSGSGGFFGFLDKLFGSVGKLGDTVKKLGSDVRTAGGDVRSTIDELSASGTRSAIVENLPLIIGIIVVLGLIIFIAIYAAKSK